MQAEVVKGQQGNVARIQSELATAKTETQRLLGDQAKREQGILQQQRALLKATEQNRELEKRLRELEQKLSPKGEAQ